MRTLTWALALLWACGSHRLLGDDAKSQVATKEVNPARQEFESLYNEWQVVAKQLTQLDAIYRRSNDKERDRIRGEFATALTESNQVLDRLVPSLIKVYTSDTDDNQLAELVATLATLSYQGDRYEQSLQLARLLAEHYRDRPAVHNLAGRAAYELGLLDEAQEHLLRARELQGLDDGSQRMLESISSQRERLDAEQARVAAEAKADNLPRVLLKTTRGDMVLELFEDDAPNTVASFLGLVDDGFYDGLDFFRVVPGFGAMAGTLSNDGIGGPGYETQLETPQTGSRPHLRGYLSMVPLTDKTNGSQFFITLRPSGAERLDGKQTVFGRVIMGLDVLERLHKVDPRGPRGIIVPDRIIEAKKLRAREHPYQVVSTADLGQRYYIEGLQLFQKGNQTAAEAAFRQGLEFLPAHHSLHFNLAATLLNQRRLEEAKQELHSVLKYNPKHMRAHYFLGSILVEKGQREEGIRHLEVATQIDPTYAPAREMLKKAQAVQ